MIHAIELNGFRGIREGKLIDLSPLVLLVGPNGSGKSTILDAVMIAANPNPTEAVGQMVLRRKGLRKGARWLLWKGEEPGKAVITIGTKIVSRSCELMVEPGPEPNIDDIRFNIVDNNASSVTGTVHFTRFLVEEKVKIRFIPQGGAVKPLEDVPDVRFLDFSSTNLDTPLYQLYTTIVEQGLRQQVHGILKDLIPDLNAIEILAEGDQPLVYLTFRDRAVPAALAGDGVRLLLQLSCELAIRRGGVVLLEEPEAHMHPAAIRQSAKVILAAIRRDIQVVLTTHSLELIDALLGEATKEDLPKLSVYRLRLQDGSLSSSRLSGPDVAFARSQIEDDLR